MTPSGIEPATRKRVINGINSKKKKCERRKIRKKQE
jgi:hypothetical protein